MKNFDEFSKDTSNIFIRWGGANAVRQKGDKNKKSITWHYPPDSRGIYAFPLKGVEKFLAGHRLKERYSRIKYNDNIWHHLTDRVKNSEVLARKGSWVLTTFKTWKKAFSKEMLSLKLTGWSGKINKNSDELSYLTYYWQHYMRHRYPFVNDTNHKSNDPVLDARFKRLINREAPTKEDLMDPDFLTVSTNGIEDSYFYTFKEWKDDIKGNSRGGYAGDHLEVFLPNVN